MINYLETNLFNIKQVIGAGHHFNPFVLTSKQAYFYVGTEFDEVNYQWRWKNGKERFHSLNHLQFRVLKYDTGFFFEQKI